MVYLVVIFSLFLIIAGFMLAYYADYRLQEMKKEEVLTKYYGTSYHVFTRNEYDDIKSNNILAGEYVIYRQLKAYEEVGGKFLFDVYLPKEDGTTAKIDVLFMTPKGIFVINSKNYSGNIYGAEDEAEWIQSFDNSSIRFLNPIMENRVSIECLKKVIGEELPIYSMIVFSDESYLKNVPAFLRDTFVVNNSKLNRVLRTILNSTEQLVSFRDIEELQKELFPLSQVTEMEKEEHIKNVREQLAVVRKEAREARLEQLEAEAAW